MVAENVVAMGRIRFGCQDTVGREAKRRGGHILDVAKRVTPASLHYFRRIFSPTSRGRSATVSTPAVSSAVARSVNCVAVARFFSATL